MKKVVSILYILGWVSYLFIFMAKKSDFPLPYFFKCYFTDLLALPLTLGATTFLLKKYTLNKEFDLSPLKILVACLYFSALFEWFLPYYSNAYTSDFFDVVCYFTGGGMYLCITRYTKTKLVRNAATI